MIDSKTDKPLFNQTAWDKAANVLKEILAGYASDPPGFSFYQQQLSAKGEPVFDKLGCALITCSRGTNDTECTHKQIMTTFGSWCTGCEMSDCLMAERRHRYNQRVSERRRVGFPKIGHSDTWLVDQLQLLVEHNHDVLWFPGWSNTSDYISTRESFGTIALQSQEMTDAINALVFHPPRLQPRKLTRDETYLCSVMGTNLPLLPVHGPAECMLFQKLTLQLPAPVDFDCMSMEWLKHVDGINVFPKLPVYLRTHFAAWQRNQRVRDAVETAASGKEILTALNSMTLSSSLPASDQHAPSGDGMSHVETSTEASGSSVTTPSPLSASCDVIAAAAARTADGTSARTGCVRATPSVPLLASLFPPPLQPPIMPQPPLSMPRPDSSVVGGSTIGIITPGLASARPEKRGNGQRMKDKRPRAERRCKKCVAHGNSDRAAVCPGRGPTGKCNFVTVE
jgi:hypothetical protein